MQRCLQLAANGRGMVSPNPMVGAVVVYDGRIIGEGFHVKYGKAHAEVNAIRSVKDKSLLKNSTIYVSLEPCSHYGKTPPCAQLIIESKIPRVVIACKDPFPEVSGRGIKMLEDAQIDVVCGVLEQEAIRLNKEFITAQTKDRPYIYLKWAQTKDGFIDRERVDSSMEPLLISSDFTRMLVHKRRAEVASIMVGTNTVVKDNPSLTTRFWYGKNPARIILDRNGRLSPESKIYDDKANTIIFTEQKANIHAKNVRIEEIDFNNNLLENLFNVLKKLKINSILIEGGSILLQSIIDIGLWDEACVEISNTQIREGVKAPDIRKYKVNVNKWGASLVQNTKNR